MNKKLIKEINTKHAKAADKWYRMLHNFGSELIDYYDETIYISINMSHATNWKKDAQTTAVQFADSYKTCAAAELADAKRYHVTIFKSSNSSNFGFLISLEDARDKEFLKHNLDFIVDQKTEVEIEEGIYYEEVFEGEF